MAAFNIWNMNFVGFPNDWQTKHRVKSFFWNPRHLLTCEGSHSRYSQFLLRVTTFSLLLNSTFFVGRFTLLTYFANAKRERKDFYPENAYSESVFWETKKGLHPSFLPSMHDCLPQIGKKMSIKFCNTWFFFLTWGWDIMLTKKVILDTLYKKIAIIGLGFAYYIYGNESIKTWFLV